MKTIEIIIPEGFMNCTVTDSNHFMCDTNNSKKPGVFIVPLPKGQWSILRQGWVKDDHRYGKSIVLWRKSIIDRLTFNWMVKKYIVKDIKDGR
jgi:hypothetical protein